MSDRSGARLIGEILEILCEYPDSRKEIARKIWKGPWQQVDAHWTQIPVDKEVFVILGLAKVVESEMGLEFIDG